MGFLFITNEDNFYYAGDTSLTLDMQLIPRWANLTSVFYPLATILRWVLAMQLLLPILLNVMLWLGFITTLSVYRNRYRKSNPGF
jgi:hypothetical protein